MTKLKLTITLDDSCSLTATDTTGFYDAGTNPFGFLPEANGDALALNIYKLSHGYFFNVLLYNKYACTPIIVNTAETFYKVASVNTTYANNFTPSVYPLTQDGTFTIKRFFIPSDTFYTANHTSGIYSGVDMYYTDGDQIFKIIDSVATPISVTSFINANFSNSDIIYTSATFISTCYTNACYYKILSTLLDINLGVCEIPANVSELIQSRDLLYMTLEVIKYLQDENNLTQIQKLIEVLNICGGICASTLKATSSTNCGCDG